MCTLKSNHRNLAISEEIFLAMGVWIRCALGMAFKFKVLKKNSWDWSNPKEKSPHTLKVSQHQNFYPRWVVDIFFKILFCIDNFYVCNIWTWQLLTISPGNMSKFAKNPKKTFEAFASDFFLLPQCKNSPKRNHWPSPSQTLKYPNSTLGNTKNPTMRQAINFSFHNFWMNRAKVIQFKVIIVLRNFKNFNNDFFTN